MKETIRKSYKKVRIQFIFDFRKVNRLKNEDKEGNSAVVTDV